MNWSFSYTVDPVCANTVTKNCVTGFEYGTTPAGGTTLVIIGIAPNPATTAASAASSDSAIRANQTSIVIQLGDHGEVNCSKGRVRGATRVS